MITRVLTHLTKSCTLVLVILLSSSWGLQSQDVSYSCQCKETLADGVIEFKIRAFGTAGASWEVANAVNLYYDAALTMPITDATMIPDVNGSGNYCLVGFSADGILPTVDVYDGINPAVALQMLTCRTPDVEILPEEPDPAQLCVGGLRRFCIEDLYGTLTNITWTAMGSSAVTQLAGGKCADIEYPSAGTYVISVAGETVTGCQFTDDLVVVVEDISDDFELQGDCEIFTCNESPDQNFMLGGSAGEATDFKLYLSDGMGGLGTLMSTTTGSGTGSGAGPTMTGMPINFPADGDYVLVACSANPSVHSCGFEVRKDISVKSAVDYATVSGPSCTCTDVPHLFTLDNATDFTGVTWSISPATGWAINPASGMSPAVDILFTNAGSYVVTVSGTVAAGQPNAGCPFVTNYTVEVTDQQVNFIACNNNVNVSLNNNCELDITPDMILEGNHLCNDAYNLVVRDAAGNIITGTITQNLLGEVLTVTVEQDCGDNSCWGYLTVEDKSITPLECPVGPISTLCFEFDDFSVFDDIVGLPLFDAGVTGTYRATTNDWLVSGHDNCSDVILEYS